MESLHTFEKTVAQWYEGLPHLPDGGRKWLAENAWWLALIGVVLSAVGLLAVIPLLLLSFGLSAAFGGLVAPHGGHFGLAWLGILVSLVSIVADIALLGTAIQPLKALAKRGWDLVFLSLLVGLALSVIEALLSYNIFSVITAVLWSGVYGYFVFEIRDLFGGKRVVAKAPEFKKEVEKKSDNKKDK